MQNNYGEEADTPLRNAALQPRIIDQDSCSDMSDITENNSIIAHSRRKRMRISDDEIESADAPSISDDLKPSVESKIRQKIMKTEDDSMPLPDPFPLPKYYPQDVEVALREKKMSSKVKRKFISEVSSAMLCYKRYPTKEDYLCVARTVVQAYPFFKSCDAKPYVSYIIMNLYFHVHYLSPINSFTGCSHQESYE